MQVWEGWRLTIWTTVAILIMAAVTLIRGHFDEPAILNAIRETARTSGVLFLLAFAAPGVRPSGVRRWFQRNSPALLLAFTGSHLVHFLLLITWVVLFPHSLLEELPIPFIVLALALYAVIFLLARTALRSMSSASLQLNGRERAAMYVLWAVFTFSFAARSLAGPLYPLLALLGVTALVLRLGSRKPGNPMLGEAGS
ncbi:MAG TPA: hypothetical protein VFR10_05705 [bacterium]|nr:hypothetical protein [bacterium]